MAIFTLSSLAHVQTAIDLLGHAQGAYTVADILKRALADVDVSAEFDSQLQQARSEHGRSHEGPADADRAALKILKTAARADDEQQTALLELLALAIRKLGVAKGSQVLSLLLYACGIDPTLFVVAFKLCAVLAQTEAGKRIVAAAGPKIQRAVRNSAASEHLAEPLRQLAATFDRQGDELWTQLETAKGFTQRTAASSLEAATSFFDGLRPQRSTSEPGGDSSEPPQAT